MIDVAKKASEFDYITAIPVVRQFSCVSVRCLFRKGTTAKNLKEKQIGGPKYISPIANRLSSQLLIEGALCHPCNRHLLRQVTKEISLPPGTRDCILSQVPDAAYLLYPPWDIEVFNIPTSDGFHLNRSTKELRIPCVSCSNWFIHCHMSTIN